MNDTVTAPRVFGRPLWAWASAMTTRFVQHRDGDWRLRLRCRVARFILWPLCRALTGHRQARGEWGYGGGEMFDVFCAYCHFPWQVPVSETPSEHLLASLFHGPTPNEGGGE